MKIPLNIARRKISIRQPIGNIPPVESNVSKKRHGINKIKDSQHRLIELLELDISKSRPMRQAERKECLTLLRKLRPIFARTLDESGERDELVDQIKNLRSRSGIIENDDLVEPSVTDCDWEPSIPSTALVLNTVTDTPQEIVPPSEPEEECEITRIPSTPPKRKHVQGTTEGQTSTLRRKTNGKTYYSTSRLLSNDNVEDCAVPNTATTSTVRLIRKATSVKKRSLDRSPLSPHNDVIMDDFSEDEKVAHSPAVSKRKLRIRPKLALLVPTKKPSQAAYQNSSPKKAEEAKRTPMEVDETATGRSKRRLASVESNQKRQKRQLVVDVQADLSDHQATSQSHLKDVFMLEQPASTPNISSKTTTANPPRTKTAKPLKTTTANPPEATAENSPKTTTAKLPKTTTAKTPKTKTAKTPKTTTANPPEATAENSPKTITAKLPKTTTAKTPKTKMANSPKATTANPPEATAENSPKTTSAKPPKTTTANPSEATTASSPKTTTAKLPKTTTAKPPKATTAKPRKTTTAKPPKTTTANPPEAKTANPPEATTAKLPKTTTANPPEATTANPPEAKTANPPEATTAKLLKATTANLPEAKTANPPEATTAKLPKTTAVNPPEAKTANPPEATTAKLLKATTANLPEAKTANPPEATTAKLPKATTANPPEATTASSPKTTATNSPRVEGHAGWSSPMQSAQTSSELTIELDFSSSSSWQTHFSSPSPKNNSILPPSSMPSTPTYPPATIHTEASSSPIAPNSPLLKKSTLLPRAPSHTVDDKDTAFPTAPLQELENDNVQNCDSLSDAAIVCLPQGEAVDKIACGGLSGTEVYARVAVVTKSSVKVWSAKIEEIQNKEAWVCDIEINKEAENDMTCLSFTEDDTALVIVERTRRLIFPNSKYTHCVDHFTIVDLGNSAPSVTTLSDEVIVEQNKDVDTECLKMKIISWDDKSCIVVLGQSSQSGVDMVRFKNLPNSQRLVERNNLPLHLAKPHVSRPLVSLCSIQNYDDLAVATFNDFVAIWNVATLELLSVIESNSFPFPLSSFESSLSCITAMTLKGWQSRLGDMPHSAKSEFHPFVLGIMARLIKDVNDCCETPQGPGLEMIVLKAGTAGPSSPYEGTNDVLFEEVVASEELIVGSMIGKGIGVWEKASTQQHAILHFGEKENAWKRPKIAVHPLSLYIAAGDEHGCVHLVFNCAPRCL